MKCVLQTQREEVCDQALLRGQVPHKGTEKLAADVPGGGARPAFCPEHVPSFHGKGKNNHKPVLNSKGEGSPPPPPTHTQEPCGGGQDALRETAKGVEGCGVAGGEGAARRQHGWSKGPTPRGRALTAATLPFLPPTEICPNSFCPLCSSPSLDLPAQNERTSRVVNRKPRRGRGVGEGLLPLSC